MTNRLPLEGWRLVLGSFFGSGLVPWAPGTFGSIAAAIPLFFIPPELWPKALLAMTLASTILCVVIARSLPPDRQDPGAFVLDEAAGLWLAVAALGPDPLVILAGLGLFRLFDITKPFPLKRLEKVGGGFGIVLDDLAAGALAFGVLLLIRPFIAS